MRFIRILPLTHRWRVCRINISLSDISCEVSGKRAVSLVVVNRCKLGCVSAAGMLSMYSNLLKEVYYFCSQYHSQPSFQGNMIRNCALNLITRSLLELVIKPLVT